MPHNATIGRLQLGRGRQTAINRLAKEILDADETGTLTPAQATAQARAKLEGQNLGIEGLGAGGASRLPQELRQELESVGGGQEVGDDPAPPTSILSYEADSSEDAINVPPAPIGERRSIDIPPAPETAGRGDQVARILEVLGGVGAGIGERRSIGKANKLTAQRQALSNLVNTLRGSSTTGVSPEQAKPGLLSILGGGLRSGAKAFREGEEVGRQERNVAGRQGFMDEVELAKLANLTTSAQAAMARESRLGTPKPLKPGVTRDQARVFEPIGITFAMGDPYGSFDEEVAIAEIKEANPGIDDADLKGALIVARGADVETRNGQRTVVSQALKGAFGSAGELSSSQLLNQFNAIVFSQGIYLPIEQSRELVKAIEATSDIVEFSVANRTKMANLFALRSGISRIRQRLRDPSFAKHLTFLGARENQLKGSISARLLPPEVRQAMTALGFTKELLLRTFTGAAAPETEFTRFGRDFVGSLTDGPISLEAQLGTLDQGLRDQLDGITKGAKVGRGGEVGRDGEEEGSAEEETPEQFVERLREQAQARAKGSVGENLEAISDPTDLTNILKLLQDTITEAWEREGNN